MAKAIDLTGRRFGKLTVTGLNPAPYISPGGKPTRRWDCVCDCGTHVTVLQNQLTTKRNPTQSCGCSRLLANLLTNKSGHFEDLTGRRFGRLTVLESALLEKPEANGNKTGWRCRCDCGKEIIIPRRALISSKTQSCGCLIGEKARERVAHDVKQFDGTTVTAIRPERPANSNSKSGVKGVYWSNREQCWVAKITFRRKGITIGRFSTLEAAKAARKQAEEKYFAPVIEKWGENKE